MTDTRERKAAVRRDVRAALAALDEDERRRRGESAVRRLLDLPRIAGAPGLLLFRSMPDEIDTALLFAAAHAREARVFAPRIVGSDLRFVGVVPATRWTRGTTRALEPESGSVLDAGTLADARAAIVVPGVAFAPDGSRLGRGGGHYDRALQELRRDVGELLAIGLALDLQIVDELPTEPHDQRVDVVVTESRVVGVISPSLAASAAASPQRGEADSPLPLGRGRPKAG